MRMLIAGGTGLVGQHLTKHWLEKKYNITILSRSKQKVTKQFGDTVQYMDWDEFMCLPNHELRIFNSIINLCGENIGASRWTKTRKKAILDSRIQSTKNIVSKLLPLADNAPRLFNASAIGVYGLQETPSKHLPPSLDEDTTIHQETPKDFLMAVGIEWEKATAPAKAHGIHVVNLRFGVILTPKGGALEKIVMPFRLGVGGKIASGHQPFSWIHIQDLLHIIDFLHVNNQLHGPINCVAPNPVMQQTLAKAIAQKLHRPCLFPLPRFMVGLLLGEMGKTLLVKGQNVYPKRLIEHDFDFKYPTIEVAINDLLA